MQIRLAHLRDQGIDFAVFDADAVARTSSARSALLAQLTQVARQSGLRIQKSALAFVENGQVTFYGAPDLVDYLASIGGVSMWTHTVTLP